MLLWRSMVVVGMLFFFVMTVITCFCCCCYEHCCSMMKRNHCCCCCCCCSWRESWFVVVIAFGDFFATVVGRRAYNWWLGLVFMRFVCWFFLFSQSFRRFCFVVGKCRQINCLGPAIQKKARRTILEWEEPKRANLSHTPYRTATGSSIVEGTNHKNGFSSKATFIRVDCLVLLPFG